MTPTGVPSSVQLIYPKRLGYTPNPRRRQRLPLVIGAQDLIIHRYKPYGRQLCRHQIPQTRSGNNRSTLRLRGAAVAAQGPSATYV